MNFRVPNPQLGNPSTYNNGGYPDSPYFKQPNPYYQNNYPSPRKQENFSPVKQQNSYKVDLTLPLISPKLNRMDSVRTNLDTFQTEPSYKDSKDSFYPFGSPGHYRNSSALRVSNPGEIYITKSPLPNFENNIPPLSTHRHTKSLNIYTNNYNNPFIPSYNQQPYLSQFQPQPIMPIPNPTYMRLVMEDKESDKRIYGAVKKQNDIIEKLADQLGEQSRYMLQSQKNDVEEKLRLLEMEHALKREEHNIMLKERLEKKREKLSLSEKAKPKKKKSANDEMFDFISRMVLIQEYGKQNGGSRDNLSPEHQQSPYSVGKKKNKLPPIKKKKKKRVTKIYMGDDDSGSGEYNQDYNGYDDDDIDENEDEDDELQTDRTQEDKSPKGKKRKNKGQDDSPTKKDSEPVDKRLKRAKAKQNLRFILWGMTYPSILFGDVRHKVESRKKEIHDQMSTLIQINFNNAIDFLLKFAEPEIIKLVSAQKSLELYIPGKQMHEKEFDARVEVIVGNYKRLFDKICFGTKEQNFNANFLRFLAFISEDGGIPPNGFMFDFEIKRFMFSYYATLKNMTSVMSKMVIGCFILLRVLLHKLIMRPWENINAISEKKVDKKSLVSIGSLLYHTVLDLFRGTVPTHKDNQAFLHPDLKIKPAAYQLVAVETKDGDEESKTDKGKEPEPIKGFLSKDLIAPFFKNKKKYDELKKVIEGWLEQMYQLTHDLYKNASKEEKETLGLPK